MVYSRVTPTGNGLHLPSFNQQFKDFANDDEENPKLNIWTRSYSPVNYDNMKPRYEATWLPLVQRKIAKTPHFLDQLWEKVTGHRPSGTATSSAVVEDEVLLSD